MKDNINGMFVEYLGVSQNVLKTLKGTRFWNPETVYKDLYLKNVEDAIEKFNISKDFFEPCWISYFPILGGSPELELHQSKVKGKRVFKSVMRQGYDVDNYSGMTKMIQDKLNKLNVIKKDDSNHLKGVFFNQHYLDKDFKVNGYVVIIERIVDDNKFPDLNKHYKKFKEILKILEKTIK